MADRLMPATVVQLRQMVQRLLSAGVPRHVVHDRIIGESRAHAEFDQKAMQDFGAVARMAPVELPRRAGDEPMYFRTGDGSPGGRRSIAGFREYLEAP